jgi:hypothetical protein
VARPRFCCAAAPTEGSREAVEEVEETTRVDRPVTALVDGACRESILKCWLCSIELWCGRG